MTEAFDASDHGSMVSVHRSVHIIPITPMHPATTYTTSHTLSVFPSSPTSIPDAKRKLYTSLHFSHLRCTLGSMVQDALLAISESAKIFITYITAAANDACKEGKRQTMSEADVFTALEDLDFGELIPSLRGSMEGTITCFTPLPAHLRIRDSFPGWKVNVRGLREGFFLGGGGGAV